LNKSNFQFNVLDAASNVSVIKSEYSKAFNEYRRVNKRLKQLVEAEKQAISDKDYITFQLKDFEGVSLEELNENIRLILKGKLKGRTLVNLGS